MCLECQAAPPSGRLWGCDAASQPLGRGHGLFQCSAHVFEALWISHLLPPTIGDMEGIDHLIKIGADLGSAYRKLRLIQRAGDALEQAL